MDELDVAERVTPVVTLISMPWTTLGEPSLGLALLKAVLKKEGIRCNVLHLSLFMLEHLKANTYFSIARVYALNDFLFSGIIDPELTQRQLRLLRSKIAELLHDGTIDPALYGGFEGVIERILNLRSKIVPQWVDKWAKEISESDSTLIGFTCMFDQTIAWIALAKRIRELNDEKMIALGGYAVRSPTAEMIVQSFPWVDAVCNGEGEETIVQLAESSAKARPLLSVCGIVVQPVGSLLTFETPSARQVDLNSNPAPDFEDFFLDTKRLSAEYSVDVTPIDLPIENSRGCWWGAKHHCTFCGIKDEDMTYRARSPERVVEDMEHMSQLHGIDFFHFTDYILPHQYFLTLLPALREKKAPFILSGEMKANIDPDKFQLMAEAGFKEVQPGIESFSSAVLRNMNKGVSSLQNIEILMLGRQFGVKVLYNLLFGFPDDELAIYENMVRQLPRLLHLHPPVTCIPVLITRYAPMQTNPERFGIGKAVADPSYNLIFSERFMSSSGFRIDDFCYYYQRPFEYAPRLIKSYDRIRTIAQKWTAVTSQNSASLFVKDISESNEILIYDSREDQEKEIVLSPDEASVLNALSRPMAIHRLPEILHGVVSPANIHSCLDRLDELELIFTDEEKAISLVHRSKPSG